MNLLLEKHNSRALTELLDKIKEKIKMYSYNDSQDEKLILHKDFAPYNVVFNYQNDVI
jgi:Ser/Thr protein kinase RdoA (MazF antagonist)